MRTAGTFRSILVSGCSVLALGALALEATAGGFAIREQSTEFQGMSFAGNAAGGGGISGMYWNPAVAAYAPAGLLIEAHGAFILPDTHINGSVFFGGIDLGLPSSSAQFGKEAIVPAGYNTFRLSPDLVFGFNANAPFGLRTGPDAHFWAGQTFARNSDIKTMNYQALLAYKLAPWVAIGAGLQLQTMRATLINASGITPTSLNAEVRGSDTAYGWSLGVNLTPFAGTNIGIGFRSAIENTLEGGIQIPGSPIPPAAQVADIDAKTTNPETLTASIRQVVTPNLMLLGTVEWSNWSRLEKLDIVCRGAANPVFCPLGAGQVVRSLDLGWHDGWFFAGGIELKAMPNLTLRGGLAYELSPIRNATERTLRLPDADRIWGSIGATYALTDRVAFDLAYTHIWVDDAPIDRTEAGLRFIGQATTDIDIVSGSVKVRFGPAPAEGAAAARSLK